MLSMYAAEEKSEPQQQNKLMSILHEIRLKRIFGSTFAKIHLCKSFAKIYMKTRETLANVQMFDKTQTKNCHRYVI
jgi:hypothetical protein